MGTTTNHKSSDPNFLSNMTGGNGLSTVKQDEQPNQNVSKGSSFKMGSFMDGGGLSKGPFEYGRHKGGL